MTTVCIILAVILVLFLLYTVIASLYFFDYAFKRKEKRINEPSAESFYGQLKPVMDKGKLWIALKDKHKATISSFDKLKLVADVIDHKYKRDKVIIMMHGFREQDYDDFSLSVKFFYEEGYNIILPDQRCHDRSGGQYISFGIKERYDCKAWIDYAVSRYGEDCQIVLMGVSMGCATVLMSLGLELPKNVKVCIADCGFTSPRAIFEHVIKHDYHLPSFPILNVCNIFCKKLAGFSIDEYSTLDAMKTNEVPVLFIHGEKDGFVPSFMSMENYRMCNAPKKFVLVENAEHAVSFPRNPEKCGKEIKDFLQNFIEE